MRKLYFISILFVLGSCGNAGDTATQGNNNDSGVNVGGATMDHPSGVDNSSVISTDTAAINVQNTIIKADSLKHHDK
ncbi:MAG: hypothetical protein WKI04_17980 [Ferruginibacter sp.]